VLNIKSMMFIKLTISGLLEIFKRKKVTLVGVRKLIKMTLLVTNLLLLYHLCLRICVIK
jgi:hypothetical protein